MGALLPFISITFSSTKRVFLPRKVAFMSPLTFIQLIYRDTSQLSHSNPSFCCNTVGTTVCSGHFEFQNTLENKEACVMIIICMFAPCSSECLCLVWTRIWVSLCHVMGHVILIPNLDYFVFHYIYLHHLFYSLIKDESRLFSSRVT